MSQTYTVQAGDTLLAIAIQQQVDFNQILALNPKYQPNPDLIFPGDVIVLPSDPEPEPQAPLPDVEPPQVKRPVSDQGSLIHPPACQGKDIKDVLFFTQDKGSQYYCLDEQAIALLNEEIQATEQLIANLKAVQDSAPDPKTATDEDHLAHIKKKQQWAEQAVNAGAIAIEETKDQTSKEETKSNQQLVKAKLKELEKRRRIVDGYNPIFNNESATQILKQRVLADIQATIEYNQALQTKAETKDQKPNNLGVNLQNFTKNKTLTTHPASQHVLEAYSVSRNQFVYVRITYVERERIAWDRRPTNSTMLSALREGNVAGFKEALLNNIKETVTKTIENPSIEMVFKEWKAEGGNSGEWKASHYILNQDGNTRFAASSEAQLLRWGATAALKSTFEPTQGKVDIGIKAEAAIALAEASVEFKSYLPYESGFPLSLSYKDANGDTQHYSFGRFRTNCTTKLSCFAGAMVTGSAGVTNQPQEQEAGHSMLLSPSVGMAVKPNGEVGVKAEGFAGVQAGGQITGALEWQDPDKETTLNFEPLAELKAEGNLNLGVGFGGDFQLILDTGKLYLYCNGRIVWGAGGSGGFGANINFENIWKLAQVVWQGLQYVDYRQLENINKDMYEYLTRTSYMAFAFNAYEAISDPAQAWENAVKLGTREVDEWWKNRQYQKNEADLLTRRILNKQAWLEVKPDKLPPETIGMMLDTLTETFFERWEEPQEQAICYLLASSISSWRKFEEVLAHMSPDGSKQEGEKVLFDNLARINAILDWQQQDDFNDWVFKLAQKDKFTKLVTIRSPLPFTPRKGNSWSDKREAVEQQLAKIGRAPQGSRYV
ncbi:LysM peptidoglycan-binding domain-containing protein [Vibrio sp. E150_018]